jgi:hypothetical protein
MPCFLSEKLLATNGPYSPRFIVLLERCIEGSLRGELTQKKHIARFSLLHTERACGNFSGFVPLPKNRIGAFFAFRIWQSTTPRRAYLRMGIPLRPCALLTGALGKSVRNFQDLRAMSMTTNKRTRTAIPHQNIRNLSCCSGFYSPWRPFDTNPDHREKKALRRKSHGVARAIEDLRGMRLALVPLPVRRECLLQGV